MADIRGGGMSHSASVHDLNYRLKAGNGTTERLKFVGKHSKDKVLSIYLQKRNIYEFEKDFKVENLHGVVRLSQFQADRLIEKDQVVVIGVLGRLSSDFGLQFGEYTVFQHETQIFPRIKMDGAVNSQGYFDLDNLFINGQAEDYHLQFSLKLPSGMPQSIQLASPSNQQETWGLSYYVYAYVTSGSAVEEMLGKQPTNHMYWNKLTIGKKSSKVFLSFAKQLVNDPAKLTQAPPSGEAVKTSFLSGGEPGMQVTATLDKPAYEYGEIISVGVKIFNPKKTRINGIKINIKQLVTMKVGGDPRNVIKTCIGRYSFSNNREDMTGNLDSGYHHSLSSLKDVEIFCDTLKIRPHIDPMRYLYQLALETKLPRSEQGSAVLASSTEFDGGAWPLGGGLDRVRTLSIEYYLNVHIDIPWSKDLIIKLPFKMVNLAGQLSIMPSIPETLNAPIFASMQPIKSGRSSRSGTILEELKDLRPVPGNLISLQDNTSQASTSPTFDDRPVNEPQRSGKRPTPPRAELITSGKSLQEDITMAKASLLQLRSKLSDEQQLVLNNVLDAQSLLLRFDHRRQVLVKEFLAVLEEVTISWLPEMSQKAAALGLVKSFSDLALFDPVASASSGSSSTAKTPVDAENNTVASGLVQNIVGRLGMFHSQLVQFQAPRSVQESKLEALNSVVDDVELMLARVLGGLQGKFDDAGNRITTEMARELISRIQRKTTGLITVIPLYDSFDEELLRLRSKITSYGMLDETEQVGSLDNVLTAWGEDFEPFSQRLAKAFESISSLMANPSLSGSVLLTLFKDYVEALIGLIQNVPSLSDRAGVAIFWQWHYLHALIDTYYCGGAEHSLIPPDRRNINWSHRIKSQIPPQWDLVNAQQHGTRLQLVGNRVIASMQQLVDTKFATSPSSSE